MPYCHSSIEKKSMEGSAGCEETSDFNSNVDAVNFHTFVI
jgi:hypothetical protein